MKVIERKQDKQGRTILIVEKGPFRHKTQYLASKCVVSDYYSWVTLPKFMLVQDRLSFQLDAWNREMK